MACSKHTINYRERKAGLNTAKMAITVPIDEKNIKNLYNTPFNFYPNSLQKISSKDT
jgi:hypothetical protein